MAGTTRKKNTSKKLTKKQKKARTQFAAILLFAVGILLSALAIVPGEGLWSGARLFMFGLMSWPFYLLGVLMMYLSVQLAMDRFGHSPGTRAAIISGLFWLVLGAAQIFSKMAPTGSFLKQLELLFQNGQILKGGGLLSAVVAMPLGLVGAPGDKIVVGLLLFVALMVTTGSTIGDLWKITKKPVVDMGNAYREKLAQNEELQKEAEKAESKRPINVDIPLDLPKRGRKNGTAAEAAPSETPEASAASRQKLLEAARAMDGDMDTPPLLPAPPEGPAEPEPDGPSEESLAYINSLIQKKTAARTPPADNEPSTQVELAPADGSLYVAPEDAETLAGQLTFEPVEVPGPKTEDYVLPDVNLLKEPKADNGGPGPEELTANAQRLVDTLQSFGVQTKITDISCGPAVTRYELQPAAGVKISKITGLSDDIALGLATSGVRIEAPIPNKSAVGIELPNKQITPVTIREVIDSPEFRDHSSKISFALGKDISGTITIADIQKMPHLLIAGATGSGKSVCINSIVISLLYHASPSEVKLLMIDPKVVELGIYNGLPHLLVPVVTDPKKAAGALGWAVGEMLRRYQIFAGHGVRDLGGYNKLCESRTDLAPLPQVVIIIDELSDLMMAAPNEVEDYICRLAQMARAAGMHLVIATQRPSVDVITGIIKANIPSRISFAVSSQIDSRTILDMGGAEKLLGQGDMLYYPVGGSKPVRVQGCYVTEEEVNRVVSFIKAHDLPEYSQEIIEEIDRQTPAEKGSRNGNSTSSDEGGDSDQDPMLPDAIEVVVEAGQASTSLLQRRLKLGYARAARIMDEMEAAGIVGPFEGSKPRQVLISRERWLEMKQNISG